MEPAPTKQNTHDQQRTRDGEDPINMVAGEVRISRCETCEDEASHPLPSPRHTHHSQEDEHRNDMNGEVGKRLDEGLSILKGIQGEQAQEKAHQNAENSRAPEEQLA